MSFAGSARVDPRLVADAGFEYDEFDVSGLPRSLGADTARALMTAVGAPGQCRAILRRRRPQVVLGAGGYVAGPMVLAARTLGIPAALTEADAHLGLANRLAAPCARRIFLAYPLAGRTGARYRVVGRPIPARSRVTEDPDEARRRFDLPADGPAILVAGGSQGAHALNEAAVAAFREGGPSVLHLCGPADIQTVCAGVSRPGYRALAFTDDFGSALAAVDLVVSRAGGSVWEIAAAGRPALLVPYPHATADHQTKNARYFAREGGAVLVPEPELDLARQVGALLADPAGLARMGAAMRALARPDAADVIAEELMALAAARG